MGIFFGTDGVRGRVGVDLTSELACKLGKSLAMLKHNAKIIIAKDTRESCDLLLLSFCSGAVSMGADVVSVGIAPTPCVSYLVKECFFDFGVVISASHNEAKYNGIKIFSKSGQKIDEKIEDIIEKNLFTTQQVLKYGAFEENTYLIELYKQHLKSICNQKINLKIVLDCSNGAAFKIAPAVFETLGAEVTTIAVSPNGKNINDNCGALFTHCLQKKVVEVGADVGFAYDGDADRVIAVTKTGNVVDGDQFLFVVAKVLQQEKRLFGNKIVATVMTNSKIEEELSQRGIELLRSKVGDKYVIENMNKENIVLGGEQAGHIIIKDYCESGDGILSSIYLAGLITKYGLNLDDELCKNLYPQEEQSVVVQDKERVLNNEKLKRAQTTATENSQIKRVLVRASGTEPKIRVMVEGFDKYIVKETMRQLLLIINDI